MSGMSTLRLVDALSSCIRGLKLSLTPSKKRLHPLYGRQLTLSCSRSAEILALNRRVARSLDVDQITAWQTEHEELYARRKQVLQQPPSTVSSSDSAVFLQCNEQSTEGEGDFELFFPSPGLQDDHSNPDSGYQVQLNTDVDSVTSVELSGAGSKRSVDSDGSSRLTSLRSCRWLTTGALDGVSVAPAHDEGDHADPSSGSTLTSQASSLTATNDDDVTSAFNPGPHVTAAAILKDGDVDSVYEELNDNVIHSHSVPPLPPPPLMFTPTRTSDYDDEEFEEFPPPPPLIIPAVSPCSAVPVVSTLNKLPPPPPASTRSSSSYEAEEFPVFSAPPPAPLLLLSPVGSAGPSSDVTVFATPKKLPPPPTPPKPFKKSRDSASSGVASVASCSSTSSSASSMSRQSGIRRNSLPPTPPAPSATSPPPPPPRPPVAAFEFPPPPTFTTLPDDTVQRSPTNSVATPTPAPPPGLLLSPQDEWTTDEQWPPSPTESHYSTIAEALRETDTGAGGLTAAIKGVKLRAVTNPVNSPAPATHRDPMSALVDQLHCGVQLRPTALGTIIRGVDSIPASNVQATANSTQEADYDDEEYANCNELPLSPKAPVKPLPPVPVKKTAPQRNSAAFSSYAELCHSTNHIDVTKLPGYQAIPPDCPQWKRALIEKKNAQLLSEAEKEDEVKRQEEERWKNVPEWKRNLIAKKQERSATSR